MWKTLQLYFGRTTEKHVPALLSRIRPKYFIGYSQQFLFVEQTFNSRFHPAQCHLNATAGAGSFKSNFDMFAFFDGN
jgi:hypothetical protein